MLFKRSQALDTFNTAVVSPIYYVMFTSATLLAAAIMFKVIHCTVIHESDGHKTSFMGVFFVCMLASHPLLLSLEIYGLKKLHFFVLVSRSGTFKQESR